MPQCISNSVLHMQVTLPEAAAFLQNVSQLNAAAAAAGQSQG